MHAFKLQFQCNKTENILLPFLLSSSFFSSFSSFFVSSSFFVFWPNSKFTTSFFFSIFTHDTCNNADSSSMKFVYHKRTWLGQPLGSNTAGPQLTFLQRWTGTLKVNSQPFSPKNTVSDPYQILFLGRLSFNLIWQVSGLHHNLFSFLGDFGDATFVHNKRNKGFCHLSNQLRCDHQSTKMLEGKRKSR